MPHTPSAAPRGAGALLGGATIVAALALALHPAEGGTTAAEILAAIVAGGVRAHLVHGALIAAFVGYALAFTEFAVLLGLRRPLVRAALVAYLLGTALILAAGLIDGFAILDVARHFLAAGPDGIKTGFDLIVFGDIVVQNWIDLGLALVSLATSLWSLALFAHGAGHRLTAVTGLLAGLLSIALLLGSVPSLAPFQLMALLAVQAIWNLAAARLMLWGQGIPTLAR